MATRRPLATETIKALHNRHTQMVPQHMSQDRFLKLKEVQTMFGVSRSTVWRWQAEHGLKVIRVGDVVRIRESDLRTFLNKHESREPADQAEPFQAAT